MANIYSLQLLRNGTPFTSYTAAVEAITGDTTRQDGILKLARYTSSTETSGNTKYNTNTVKTVFGLYYKPASGEGSWTIFDSYHEVIQNIQEQIDSITGGTGSIAQQIQEALNQLDFAGVTGNVVTQVTQVDGTVSASGANVGNLVLTDYTQGTESGDVASSDSINGAIAKLQNQIKALDAEKDSQIEALDYTDTAVTGSYVSKVDEANGVISVTREALPSVNAISEAGKPITAVSESLGTISATAGTINAEFVNVADGGNLFTGSTVEDVLAEIDAAYKAADAAIVGDATTSGNTLGKLEDRIEALDADAKEYSIVKTTTGLPETVKERYELQDADGHVSGDTIEIPKDSHIVSITYNGETQKLTYTYLDASGNTQSTDVDMSQLVLETEFGSGVTVTDHVAHGVVDPYSETFLTVGANGFKLAGVQDAINEANSAVNDLSGKTVTGIDMTGGTAAIAAADDGTKKITINTDGSQILATGYAKGSDKSAIAASDSINTALAKLENQVAAANATVQKDAAASHITLSSTTGSNGETIYTIGESDVASKTGLDAEIAARKAVDGVNGDTYTADTNANYISGASTLYGADQALDAALKTVADSANSAQTEIDAIETAVGLNADGAHAQSQGHYTSGANSIEGEIVALDGQVKANADAIDALEDAFVSGATMNGTAVTKPNNALAFTAVGKQTAATATGNEAIVVETDANGGLTLGIASLDAGTY